jgi:hypothetical protein
MTIFSTAPRTDMKGMKADDNHFAYLNRSARPEAERVRNLVDRWSLQLPQEERLEWRERFTSNSTPAHHAAFFELILHAWLLKLGYTVEHHPQISGISKRPDFHISDRSGYSFYLEARSTHGESTENARISRFKSQIVSEVAKIESELFFVFLSVKKQPSYQPGLRRFREDVSSWLNALDYEDVLEASRRGDTDSSAKTFSVGGGTVVLRPIPRNQKGKRSPVYGGGMMGEAVWVDTQTTIQTAIKKKASKYGMIGKPYIIAINDMTDYSDEDHFYDAVFGKEVVTFSSDGSHGMGRNNTGIFGTRAHSRHRRVSGILACIRIDPWNFANKTPIFIAHPWATNKVGNIFGPCSGHFMQDDILTASLDKPNFASIFDLPSTWPG